MESLTNLLNSNLDVSNLNSVNNTINTIDKYIANLTSQVEEAISIQYDDVASVMENTNAVYQQAKESLSEFEQLNANLSKDSKIEIVSTEDIQKMLMNKMLKSESMISVLHKLCQCHELVEASGDCSTMFEEAEKLNQAKVKLKSLCVQEQDAKVIRVLQDEIDMKLFNIFKAVNDWSECLKIEDKYVVWADDTSTKLSENTKILEVIAQSEVKTIARTIADSVNSKIMSPIVNDNLTCYLEVSNELSFVKNASPHIECLVELINCILLFNQSIVPDNDVFREEFWDEINSYLIPLIKDRCIKLCIPDNISGLSDFAATIVPAVQEFEERVTNLKIFPNSGHELSQYAANYHVLFADKYKEKYYQQAREILLKCDCSSIPVSTVVIRPTGQDEPEPPKDPCSPLSLKYPKTDEILRLPEFPVSKKVVKLSELVVHILKEATSGSLPSTAAQFLCQTARNIVELFQVPSFDPFDDKENPTKAAQNFCDSWFLAHQLVWTSIEFKNRLPEGVIFIDLVYLLRTKGAMRLKNNSDALISKITTLLNQVGGLDGQNKDNHGMVIEMAFVQIVAVLSQFSTAWKCHLPTDQYLKLLGGCIDKLLEAITSDTLKIEDISAKHSTCLSNNFCLLMDQLSKIRGNDLPEDSDSWCRFKLMANVMDDSLVKIVDDWENGVLSAYFKAAEIQHLTRALFQNTDKNASLRRKITGDII